MLHLPGPLLRMSDLLAERDLAAMQQATSVTIPKRCHAALVTGTSRFNDLLSRGFHRCSSDSRAAQPRPEPLCSAQSA
jgi:hypothetical protein